MDYCGQFVNAIHELLWSAYNCNSSYLNKTLPLEPFIHTISISFRFSLQFEKIVCFHCFDSLFIPYKPSLLHVFVHCSDVHKAVSNSHIADPSDSFLICIIVVSAADRARVDHYSPVWHTLLTWLWQTRNLSLFSPTLLDDLISPFLGKALHLGRCSFEVFSLAKRGQSSSVAKIPCE